MKKLLYILILTTILIIPNIDKKNNALSQSVKLELKNPSIILKDNKSKISFILINNTENILYVKNIEIIVKDNEKNIICKKMISVNKNINKNEKIIIEDEVNYDLSNANSLDYTIY